jgi:hypothetical protein
LRWKERNPTTLVLSTDTGYERDYSVDPYEGYYRILGVWFPIGDVRRDLSPKDRVLGIEVKGKAKAYPLTVLREKPGSLTDEIAGEPIRIEITPAGEVIAVTDQMGRQVSSTYSYWFSWQAFHPATEVYRK